MRSQTMPRGILDTFAQPVEIAGMRVQPVAIGRGPYAAVDKDDGAPYVRGEAMAKGSP
jgi:hypothetical protein